MRKIEEGVEAYDFLLGTRHVRVFNDGSIIMDHPYVPLYIYPDYLSTLEEIVGLARKLKDM